MAPVYGRRTERLAAIVGAVGYVAGGLPGARLLERLAIQISDDSVRRQVVRNAHGMHAPEAIRCLGVDDWAWRKHQTYGTIFVDLDRHKVVDLLSDRAAESVAAWLKEHPTVEIAARDRSGLYADGAASGAPDARQVADRFHLLLNLSTAIERVLEERSRELTIPAATELVGGAKPIPLATPNKPTVQKEQQQQRRQRRLGRYEEVAELHRQGYSKMAISRELALSIETVRRWLRADRFPERKPPSGRRNKVAEFATYLNERWKAGCHNSTKLFTEIRARGYKGSRQMVTLYVASWRPAGVRPSKAASPQRVAPKHAAILAAQAPEKFTPEQQTLFDRLAACCPDLLQFERSPWLSAMCRRGRFSRPIELDSEYKGLPLRPSSPLRLWSSKRSRRRHCGCGNRVEQRPNRGPDQSLKDHQTPDVRTRRVHLPSRKSASLSCPGCTGRPLPVTGLHKNCG